MKDIIERKRNGLSEAIGDEWIKKERKKRRRAKEVRSESGSCWIYTGRSMVKGEEKEEEERGIGRSKGRRKGKREERRKRRRERSL